MLLKRTLLTAACAALLCLSAEAAISFTISPIAGDTQQALLSLEGTVGTDTVDGARSAMFQFSGTPLTENIGSALNDLYLGGKKLSSMTVFSNNSTFVFGVSKGLPSGSNYSFSGGPSLIALNGNYTDLFNVGTYSVIASNGASGTDATGTLTILSSPIPEPATYAALAGCAMLGLALWKRKHTYR